MSLINYFFNSPPSWIIPLAYFVLGIFYWTGFIFLRQEALLKNKNIFYAILVLICWVVVLLHAWILYKNIYSQVELELGFALAFSASACIAMFYFATLAIFQKIELLAMIMLPVAVLMTLPPLFFSPQRIYFPESNIFLIHLGFALFSYGTLGFAVSLSLLMSFLDVRLHPFKKFKESTLLKKFIFFIFDGTSLLNLEKLLFQIIGAAFFGLSLTLLTGFIFSKELNISFRWDHKVLFSVFAWIIVGVLLIGRWYMGWRGRMAIIYVLSGYLALIFSYIGTQIVLQLILRRI